MRAFLFLSLGVLSLYGAQSVDVGERFKNSQSCKACHLHIVKDWEDSWHAKSHFANDEYFRATTQYVSKKTRKSLNGTQVECATCHNPRIAVTKTGIDYEIMAVMKLDKGSAVNKALESDVISEGINCVVCHNIDAIHEDRDQSHRGINRVSWTPTGVMSGPYEDAKSPYHKVVHREFMDSNPDQLCFVCHANDKSSEGLVFTNMQQEYANDGKKCVDCHMGVKKIGVAATLKVDNGKAKKRGIRSHGFDGAHTQTMWKDALSLALANSANELLVTINNPQPHNIPSGFGSRELLLEVTFKQGMKSVATERVSLTRYYTSKKNKPTIPHLAEKMSRDESVPAKGSKLVRVALPKGATDAEVNLYYRLVNDEVREMLELKEAIWSNKNFVASGAHKIR